MTLKLECAFKAGDPSGLNLWLYALRARPDVFQLDLQCRLNGRVFKVSDIANVIAQEDDKSFTVEFDRGSFDWATLRAYNVSFLQIATSIKSVVDADRWMESLTRLPSFVLGRLYDEEYDFWQNASDPLEYRARSRLYSHLPTRSNGLPPPLEQMEIDTSKNPGRRELRNGLIEAVGSPMWFSAEFLDRMGLTQSELRSQSWLDAERLVSGVWKVSVQGSPFDSAEGEQGILQDKVRDYFFRGGPGKTSLS